MPSPDAAVRTAACGRDLLRTVLGVLAYCALMLAMVAPEVLRF